MILNQLIKILEVAQQSTGSQRVNKVKEFQEIVWNDETIQDDALNDILSTLAYDFDYYESNESMRKEDPSYYGDERLLKVIRSGLEKLKEYQAASN